MEDFNIEYEDAGIPYMKASVDIPFEFLKNNIEQVNTDMREFSNNITDGKLIIELMFDGDDNCRLNVNRIVDGHNNVGSYDVDVTQTEDCLKVIIFKFEEATVVKAKYNGLVYTVNLKE